MCFFGALLSLNRVQGREATDLVHPETRLLASWGEYGVGFWVCIMRVLGLWCRVWGLNGGLGFRVFGGWWLRRLSFRFSNSLLPLKAL